MNIIELHIEGGILFMSVLTLLFVGVLATGIVGLSKRKKQMICVSSELAILALVWGILGQLIGLFGAFQGIEMMGSVSQAMLAGGLKVSSYTTIYGLIIFVVGKLIGTSANFIKY